MKTCSKCGEEKALEEFGRRSASKDGLTPSCRACTRRYYEENREQILERQRRYREENGGKVLERQRRYYEENREQELERRRRYYEENRERLLKTNRRQVDPHSREGFVYRLFDECDRLLYVGLTYDVEKRLFVDPSNHSSKTPWFSEVAFVWVEQFETYADAQEEERHAYATEAPLYNRAPLYPTRERPSPVAASEFDLETRAFVDL